MTAVLVFLASRNNRTPSKTFSIIREADGCTHDSSNYPRSTTNSLVRSLAEFFGRNYSDNLFQAFHWRDKKIETEGPAVVCLVRKRMIMTFVTTKMIINGIILLDKTIQDGEDSL